ncbi:MAG: hypothetical protein ACFFAN_12030 [Promethearchaeota archaeon]
MKHARIFVSIVIVLIFIFLLLIINTSIAFTWLFPGSYNGEQYFFIGLIALFCSIVIGISIGYLIAPIFLFFHKKIMGYKLVYGIQKLTPLKKFQHLFRGFFPSLIAINISLVLTPFLRDIVITSDYLESFDDVHIGVNTFFTILPFVIGPAIGIFVAGWILNDAGLGYMNKNKIRKNDEFIDIKGVGRPYIDFLKGYAGISVIISYGVLLLTWINYVKAEHIILVIIFGGLVPIILTLGTIPCLLILDFLREHRNKYILKFAKKMGITEYIKLNLDNFT